MPHSTQHTLYPLHTDHHVSILDNNAIRKRVCKACDRCRLKKSKCDGNYPCTRCKQDNAICVYGERKKSSDKVYPKGYVEMLEQQQTQTVQGLKRMYSICLSHKVWPGEPLQLQGPNNEPLTHDILHRLNCITLNENTGMMEPFEENFETIQRTLIENGAPMATQRDLDAVSTPSPPGTPIVPDTKPVLDAQHQLFLDTMNTSPESRYYGHIPLEHIGEDSMVPDSVQPAKLDLPFSSGSLFSFEGSAPPPQPLQPFQPGPGEFAFDMYDTSSFGSVGNGANLSQAYGMAPYSVAPDISMDSTPQLQQPDPDQERRRRHAFAAPEVPFHLADYINYDGMGSSSR